MDYGNPPVPHAVPHHRCSLRPYRMRQAHVPNARKILLSLEGALHGDQTAHLITVAPC
jgi:hypothetical protein